MFKKQNFNLKGIKNKLILSILPVALITYTLVCICTLIKVSDTLEKDLDTEIKLTAEVVDGKILASISETMGIMDNIKRSIENGNIDAKSIKEYLYTVADAYPESIPTGIYCGLEDGTYIDKLWTPDDPTWVMKERPWYIEGYEADKVSFGEVYMDSMTGSYIVSIYANLKDVNGKVIGVISADVPIDNISSLMEEQTIIDNGYIYAIDLYSGMIFGNHVEPDLNGQFIKDIDTDLMNQIKADIEADKYGTVEHFENVYYNVEKIEGTNFVTVAMVPKSDINTKLQSVAVNAFVTSYLGITLQLVSIYFLLVFLLKPVKNISESIDDIHGLDLTKKCKVKTKDEFGQIADKMNNLSDTLRDTIYSVKTSSEDLFNKAKQNMDSAADINSASDVQKTAMLQLTSTINELSKAIENIADGATNLAHNVNDVSAEIISVETKVKEASDKINSGNKEIMQMKDNIVIVTEFSKDLQTSVLDVRNGLDGINQMVSIIEDIASQTNLLSLNASIEAARAGEAGKGFAVVAEEIRNLSDSCQKSVTNIVETTEKLDRLVNIVLQKTQDNINIISESNEKAQNVSLAFDSIEANIDEIKIATENIGNSMKDVDSVASDMAATTQEQTASTEVVLNSCHEIEAISNEVADKGKELSNVGSKLKALSDELTEQVNQFKI